jgi:hypothetical protein
LTRCISEEYFAAMGIPLLAGRTFTAADESTDAPLVGIIDQHMARDLFPGRDPLQAILRVNATRSIRIVGVVKDAAQRFYGRPPADEMYIPFRQYVFGVFISGGAGVGRSARDRVCGAAGDLGSGPGAADREGGNAERRDRGFHLAAALFGLGV